jgi:formylglycine-generating enzyme required for sulfatase activity
VGSQVEVFRHKFSASPTVLGPNTCGKIEPEPVRYERKQMKQTATDIRTRAALAFVVIAIISPIACVPQHRWPSLTAEEAKARQYDAGQQLEQPVEITNSLGMRFVLIPAGRFMMGSPPTEIDHGDAERPHEVVLTKSFYMGTTEVTQSQWTAVMKTNPSFLEGADLPVETITWAEAVEFCDKLSAAENVVYRLPTESEWEYACRAGTTTPFSTGTTIRSDQANYDARKTYGSGVVGQYREATTPAASFAANAWGLHDMHGNVWEWCADWFGEYPGGTVTDPLGAKKGDARVVRGGCWINDPAICRSANRGHTEPESWNFHFGFRVVREVDLK